MPNTSVDQAIQEANRVAQESKAVATTAPTPAAPTAVATYQPARPPSLDDLTQGAMNVDGYLKVKEFGLLIDNKPDMIESVLVSIDMSEVQPFTGVRFGDPVVYLKTYDGSTCASGGTWNEALAKAQRVKPDIRPYMGADIPMTLLEDATSSKVINGTVATATIATKGTRLGHSTAVTNRAELAAFIKAVNDAGLKGKKVKAKIGFEPKTNPKAQRWGILTFELLGAAEEAAE